MGIYVFACKTGWQNTNKKENKIKQSIKKTEIEVCEYYRSQTTVLVETKLLPIVRALLYKAIMIMINLLRFYLEKKKKKCRKTLRIN